MFLPRRLLASGLAFCLLGSSLQANTAPIRPLAAQANPFMHEALTARVAAMPFFGRSTHPAAFQVRRPSSAQISDQPSVILDYYAALGIVLVFGVLVLFYLGLQFLFRTFREGLHVTRSVPLLAEGTSIWERAQRLKAGYYKQAGLERYFGKNISDLNRMMGLPIWITYRADDRVEVIPLALEHYQAAAREIPSELQLKVSRINALLLTARQEALLPAGLTEETVRLLQKTFAELKVAFKKIPKQSAVYSLEEKAKAIYWSTVADAVRNGATPLAFLAELKAGDQATEDIEAMLQAAGTLDQALRMFAQPGRIVYFADPANKNAGFLDWHAMLEGKPVSEGWSLSALGGGLFGTGIEVPPAWEIPTVVAALLAAVVIYHFWQSRVPPQDREFRHHFNFAA